MSLSNSVSPVKVRAGRTRGLRARRLAEALAVRACGADELERDTLRRLAARAQTLADRARGERGWLRP
jgi:hypothetical protein